MKTSYAVGDAARVRLGKPSGHTRVPGYLRGKPGVVIAVIGEFPLADDMARGLRSEPQTLYSVRFAASDVFGADGDETAAVTADLWESYLEGVQ